MPNAELLPDAPTLTTPVSPAPAIPVIIAMQDDPVCDAPDELRPPPLRERIASVLAVVLPFVGLVAGLVLLWDTTHSWVHLSLLIVGYLLTGLGITVGYHRLFTHRSFETNAFMRATLGILGSMALEGSILKWVAMHRCHHQHSDTHDDPHSPNTHGSGILGVLRGFWHAHIGWFFEPTPKDLIEKYAPDLQKDRVTRVVSRLFPLWVLLSLFMPAVIAGIITGTWLGALLGFLWGGAARIFLIHHVTWSINSVCHLWGRRPFRSHDHSRNNAIFGVLGLGEGWHNNHHAFPTSARHGLRWWQFDASYLFIRGLALVGMARNVKVPSRERVISKMAP